MSTGAIKVAEHDGVYVIRMIGDVRLTLCLSFDDFIKRMFQKENFCSAMFDLTTAEAIDSTTLGLMAKISLKERALGYEKPIVMSSNPSITRLLVTMGFEDLFRIVEADARYEISPIGPVRTEYLDEKVENQEAITRKVLEAHKVLMALNETNNSTFKELVTSLEDQM